MVFLKKKTKQVPACSFQGQPAGEERSRDRHCGIEQMLVLLSSFRRISIFYKLEEILSLFCRLANRPYEAELLKQFPTNLLTTLEGKTHQEFLTCGVRKHF